MSRVLRFALLGHPVRHSASPAMHRAALQALGLPHFYNALDCPDRPSLVNAVASLRRGLLAGANVTVPHKRAILDLVDEQDPVVQKVGAANLVVRKDDGRLLASNTDVPALVEELRSLSPTTATAVILGAGGAAAAALEACNELGVRLVAMTTRSWSTSEEVFESETAEAFRARGALTVPWPQLDAVRARSSVSTALRLQWHDLAASADIVIQATSAGMPGGRDNGASVATAIPWSRMQRRAVVLDVVYAPYETPILAAARAAGFTTVGGVGMLARQGALSLSRWVGQPVPYEIMVSAALRFLSAPPPPRA